MKFISFIIGIILPYLVLAQIKTRHPVSGNLLQISNATNYYPSDNLIGWNSSIFSQQQWPGNTVIPTVSAFNYKSQIVVPGNGWNSANNAAYPTLPPSNYSTVSGNRWNSSTLNYRPAENAPISLPSSALPSFSYNSQTVPRSGWNSSVNSYRQSGNNAANPTVPALNYNPQPIQQSANAAYPTFSGFNNYNTQQQQSQQQRHVPQNRWNSSIFNHQLANNTHQKLSSPYSLSLATPKLNNYNIQTVPSKPIFIDRTAEFLNKTRSNIPSEICYTEVPTATLVANRNAVPNGNGTTRTMSRIQICCEGYARNPHVHSKCDPICKNDCPNGICTAPNTCVCLPRNVRDHEDNCVPTCPIGCLNGSCQSDGSCVCKPGFVLDPFSRQFCRPHCSKGCNYGKCVAPETCRCMPQYELSPSSGVCQPKCDNCDGTCTAPGVCVCNPGYIRKGSICEPVCTKGCYGGTCTAPEICTCKPGFLLDSSRAICIPQCDKPCLNGLCVGHNLCSCNPGYILDNTLSNVCKAHCPSGCPNGHCTSPNFCICKPGFKKSGIKGNQNCVLF